jgi:hypothetical protein
VNKTAPLFSAIHAIPMKQPACFALPLKKDIQVLTAPF